MLIDAIQINSYISNDCYSKCLNMLPQNERIYVQKYIRRDDRVRRLIGMLLIRKIASKKFQTPMYDIEISRNIYGKPYFKTNLDTHFNISHSGMWVVCITSDKPVGIDIEQITPIDISMADRFFTSSESSLLHSLTGNDQLKRFYELWTLKESYVKAQGKGLHIRLNSFSVELNQTHNVYINAKRQPVNLQLIDIHDRYVLATCAYEIGKQPKLRINILPNFLEEVFS
ncbi:4'-phosphopantetheinyl transferase family protein [Paenibacillus gansuensis]|uniref:4'-phosphopantetheinyl transferase family protein n=1 Tax=Paenibacillus gansuensis TaxID=306542 RepID=A0ABW5PIR6_9BACL